MKNLIIFLILCTPSYSYSAECFKPINEENESRYYTSLEHNYQFYNLGQLDPVQQDLFHACCNNDTVRASGALVNQDTNAIDWVIDSVGCDCTRPLQIALKSNSLDVALLIVDALIISKKEQEDKLVQESINRFSGYDNDLDTVHKKIATIIADLKTAQKHFIEDSNASRTIQNGLNFSSEKITHLFSLITKGNERRNLLRKELKEQQQKLASERLEIEKEIRDAPYWGGDFVLRKKPEDIDNDLIAKLKQQAANISKQEEAIRNNPVDFTLEELDAFLNAAHSILAERN